MSRQTNRHEARTAAKAESSSARLELRKEAKRELLKRQTAREKAGYYSGRGVAAAIEPSRSRTTKRRVKKGKAFGRIITNYIMFDGTEFAREISLHATKGWRTHRA